MRRTWFLALLCLAGRAVYAGHCRAQNILDACLRMQHLQFKSCEYDDWECKCHSQKKVLTCYDNCPDSENRTLQEMQVQVYCAPLNGKEFNNDMIDRMTRPAKIVADDQPPAHEPAKNAAPQPAPAPPPAPKPSDDDKNVRERSDKNFSLVNDNAASGLHLCVGFMALGSDSLSEQTAAALSTLVAAHSQGFETTIYADAVALETINANIRGGIIGLLQPDDGPPRARALKGLSARDLNAKHDGIPDGSHLLFLVGSVSWPRSVWPAIVQVLTGAAYASCTLCVSTPEEIWSEMAAAFPPSAESISQPLVKSNVLAALRELLIRGQQNDKSGEIGLVDDDSVAVQTAPLLAAMSLADNMFVMPDTSHVFPGFAKRGQSSEGDGLGFLRSMDRRSGHSAGETYGTDSRQRVEQLSLNIVSFMHGLGVRAAGGSLLSLIRECQPSQADTQGTQPSLDLWETLLMQDKAVALQVLRSRLASELAAVSNNPAEATAPNRGRVTTEQLQTMVDAYNAQPQSPERSDALAQVVQAVITAERIGAGDRWQEIEGAEKTLKLVIGSIKDSLGDAFGSSHVDSDAWEEEMSAAWDQVLTAIPPLTSSMLERAASSMASAGTDAAERISQYLWQHTPAPGMALMAASLLAPAKTGIPRGQRSLLEQRLASDHAAACSASGVKLAVHDAAGQWARRIVEYADAVAASEGQRNGLTHWRELASMAMGSDGAYASLLERVASDVLGGGRCADLEHAEQGAAIAAANLLKGFG
ncbi:hypothetical protein H4S01_000101 [Coemansia sp. RSA 2610]|nr:hypothetical protein H4S01_000101 [Coemansia sp. RSA 2610]